MKINSVSFGKTIKVCAPLYKAQRVADIANGAKTNNYKMKSKINAVLDDVNIHKAIPFAFSAGSKESYVFSGNEAIRYIQSQQIMNEIIVGSYKQFGALGYSQIETELATQNHLDRVRKLIDETLIKVNNY